MITRRMEEITVCCPGDVIREFLTSKNSLLKGCSMSGKTSYDATQNEFIYYFQKILPTEEEEHKPEMLSSSDDLKTSSPSHL